MEVEIPSLFFSCLFSSLSIVRVWAGRNTWFHSILPILIPFSDTCFAMEIERCYITMMEITKNKIVERISPNVLSRLKRWDMMRLVSTSRSHNLQSQQIVPTVCVDQ